MVALGLCALAACSGGGDQRPNVILITLDTVRADHLSSYGYGLETTPHMDALAAEGTRFEHCLSTASLTPVSHASILTGLNPYQHGLRVLHAESGYRLPPSIPSIATILAGEGWNTAAILSAFPVSERFGLDQGFAYFDNGLTPEAPEAGESGQGRDERLGRRQRRSDATTDEVLRWLADEPEPFFLWIHYWDPHDPLLVPPPAEVQEFRRSQRAVAGGRPSLYDTELNYVDRQFGRLVASLRERDLYDRTLIVITADHGEGLGEHDWHAHRLLYEEQIHVPLIVKPIATSVAAGAAGAAAGRVVPETVRTIDIVPTILEELGVAGPALEGRSLFSLVRGEPDEPRRAYADQLNKWDSKAAMLEQRPADDLLHCLVGEGSKLIFRPLRPEESELYDLRLDPDEATNLYRANEPRAQRLLADLRAREPWVLAPFLPAAQPGDAAQTAAEQADAADALRELGYIDDE